MEGKQRVVVSGLGVVSALGVDELSFVERLFSGNSGIAAIRSFDTSGYRTANGAQVDDEALAAELAARGLRSPDRTLDLALLATGQALEQSGLVAADTEREPQEVGVLFGTGWGPSQSTTSALHAFFERGLKGMRPTTIPKCMMNSISSQVSMTYRLTGPNYAVASACASSTVALGLGYRMIRDGHAQRVVCGGSDAMFQPAVFAGWNNLGVMSRNPDPARACRPFDAQRDGFILGEGAGALVLETLESARSRGARIRAEILGFGESSDATHITRPSREGQVRAMSAALDSAGIQPQDVGFINAHGTATQSNDQCEAESIREVFATAADRVPVVSSKPYFGHLIGAAGAVETIATVLCLEANRAHAALNLDQPDELCELALVREEAVELEAPVAVMNSFGFGGNNAVLVLSKYAESRE